jgi:ankyrin repeat protein
MKNQVYILLLFIGFTVTAQKTNIFHNRDFWKTNPSIQVIEKQISEGSDIAALNSNAFDAVTYALLEKVAPKTVKYLLSKKGNEVNKRTHDGRTYLFWAAYKDNLEFMKYLVSKGAKTDIIDSHGYSVLNFAASTGQTNTELYDYLFKMDANIKTEKNHHGANALLLVAPYLDNFSLVKYLLSKGASLNDKDSNGNGIFEYAAKGGNRNLLKTLLEKGVKSGENTMIFASQGLPRKKNTLEAYKFLESIGVKVNVVDEKGRNPLHAIAYKSNDIAVYTYFIAKGMDVNLQDNDGDSPFMNAANSNTLEVVKFLSTYTKELNLKNEKGLSALALAVNRNAVEVIKFLLDKGANINTKDHKGNTLSYALINNFKKNKFAVFEAKLTLLEKNGLVINQIQENGNTLLHLAALRNNLKLLKYLAVFNIDVNTKNKDNLSALQIAAMKSRDAKIIKYLLSIGANKNVKTAFEETVYDLALENELLQIKSININFLK